MIIQDGDRGVSLGVVNKNRPIDVGCVLWPVSLGARQIIYQVV